MSDSKLDLDRVRSQLRGWGPQETEEALARFNSSREAEVRVESYLDRVRARLRFWGPEDVEHALNEFHRRRAAEATAMRSSVRAETRRWPALALAAALVTTAVVLFWMGRQDAQPTQVVAQPAQSEPQGSQVEPASAAEKTVALEAGSAMTLLEPTARAQIVEKTQNRLRVVLDSGRVRFDVQHKPERTLTVVAGSVSIEDLGTVFVVDRRMKEVAVSVTEGAVRVVWGDQVSSLRAGDQGLYPLEDEAAPESEPAVSTKVAPQASAWKALAQKGRYREAWEHLSRLGIGAVANTPNDLLLAADVARFSGHSAQAVAPLQRLVSGHRGDPRSPAAAFTLGSILMRELGRPAQAAGAFATAEQLAPSGNLAEDARARAAEAWFRAGDKTRARAYVQRYAARHPQGRHLASLRRMLDE